MCIRDRLLVVLLSEHRHVGPGGVEQLADHGGDTAEVAWACLLYTSDAADERSSVDLGGRRIIKKKNRHNVDHVGVLTKT